MADPEAIYHCRQLDERITTSGQPTEPQLAEIQALGVRHVVNLGLRTHEKALPDEAGGQASAGSAWPTFTSRSIFRTRPKRTSTRRDGGVEGCSGARTLHRELPGLCVLLSVPQGRA